MADLKMEVEQLKKEVEKLKRELSNRTTYQDDFGKLQIFNREVKFNKPVYDSSGTKVIN